MSSFVTSKFLVIIYLKANLVALSSSIMITTTITKLFENAKSIFYYLSCHENEWACSENYFVFLSQNSKTKHFLKIKTANQCSLNT